MSKIAEMTNGITTNAEKVLDRDLTPLEKTLIEFAVTQIEYDFWRN